MINIRKMIDRGEINGIHLLDDELKNSMIYLLENATKKKYIYAAEKSVMDYIRRNMITKENVTRTQIERIANLYSYAIKSSDYHG